MILDRLAEPSGADVLSEATRAGPIVLLISALNITARRQAAQTNKSRPCILFAEDLAIFAATLRNFLENDICRRWSGSRSWAMLQGLSVSGGAPSFRILGIPPVAQTLTIS